MWYGQAPLQRPALISTDRARPSSSRNRKLMRLGERSSPSVIGDIGKGANEPAGRGNRRASLPSGLPITMPQPFQVVRLPCPCPGSEPKLCSHCFHVSLRPNGRASVPTAAGASSTVRPGPWEMGEDLAFFGRRAGQLAAGGTRTHDQRLIRSALATSRCCRDQQQPHVRCSPAMTT